MLGACVAIAGAVNLSPSSNHSTWAGIIKLALGAYLLVAAVRKFRGRPRDGEAASMPNWMDGIAGFTAGRSLGTGVVLGAFNPKNLVVGLAAAATIASADPPLDSRLEQSQSTFSSPLWVWPHRFSRLSSLETGRTKSLTVGEPGSI